jgi:hypothetical protein
MDEISFFTTTHSIAQKQYEALRMYFIESVTAKIVAKKFGYTYRGFTTIVSDFRKKLNDNDIENLFFVSSYKGRPVTENVIEAHQIIIGLRKKFYSVADIKINLDSRGYKVSEKTIYNVLADNGFSKLPRRMKTAKQKLESPKIEAPISSMLKFENENFKSGSAGLLCFLPYISKYGIDKLIEDSDYPQTNTINRLSSILSFVCLKLSNVRRYSADDIWCMDRGMGMFAGLNVLPKTGWFTSYSSRVIPTMNTNFLKKLHKLWVSENLLGDTANIDFTTIPYWGDAAHLENNWSGKRNKALESILAVLAHDPDTGIIDYGNVNVMHKEESDVILEYLDFYTTDNTKSLKYLIFDSKLTNYQNLNELNKKGVKFITIRRRGKNMVERLDKIPANEWKSKRVEMAGNKHRTLKVYEEEAQLKDYQGNVRQINITGNGKIKPAIVITNDFELDIEKIIRKYARRWLVEKTISEQIEFFHLNHVSSSMVIKVDFDLVMSILAYNLYRVFAFDLERYEHSTAQSIYDKFILNEGDIQIEDKSIIVSLKKKRNLPLILENMGQFNDVQFTWLGGKKIQFQGASYS